MGRWQLYALMMVLDRYSRDLSFVSEFHVQAAALLIVSMYSDRIVSDWDACGSRHCIELLKEACSRPFAIVSVLALFRR